MKLSKLFFLFTLISIALSGHAQKNVDLSLKLKESQGSQSCFDVLLRSPDGHDINVAGQNYRMFYDAGNLSFQKNNITNFLDKKIYSKIDLINTEDDNIGFVSISIDGRILSDDGLKLSRTGVWQKTLNICFERLNDREFDLTWASRKKTSLFATAEVAMSEWVTEKQQQILIPNELYDFSSVDKQNLTHESINISVFPNPVAEFVNVAFETRQTGELLIKDIIGRQVIQDDLNEEYQVSYNLSGWPAGSYTVVIFDKEGSLLESKNIVKVVR